MTNYGRFKNKMKVTNYMLEIPITIKLFTTKIPTDRKLDVVAKVSDKRKAKVRTTSTSKIIIVNPTV